MKTINVRSGSMHPSNMNMRPAVAMIELIFAIVIIGITLMSAPNILSVSIKSSNVAMQQEAIAAASSQISLILTRNWDNSDSNASTGYGILGVTSRADRNVSDYNMTRIYNTNAGFTMASTLANFGLDINDNGMKNDIDDFANENKSLQLYAGEIASLANNEGEYIDKDIFTTTTITYGDDTANYANISLTFNNPFSVSASTSSNIKLIRVQLQTARAEEELAKNISLYAFSCNIGTPNTGVISMP